MGFETTFMFGEMILPQICDDYDKVIYSVKHNLYVIINTSLATCLGSSKPSADQFLLYRHVAFSEYAHYGIPYCLKPFLF